MPQKIATWLLFLFVIADLAFSFYQHYTTPFDGDMAGGIVPAADVEPVLTDPLGISVFSEDKVYPNPNRFFSHWLFYQYFNSTPHALHTISDPIDAAYLACAIIKTLIQASLIWLIAFIVTGTKKIFHFQFLVAAAIITPLFQLNGYRAAMGIIDPATTYTFFYALPTLLVFVYLAPLFLKLLYQKSLRFWRYLKFVWPIFALVVFLSGPLNPGIMLVVAVILAVYVGFKKSLGNMDRSVLGFLVIPGVIVAGYSLYLGQFNAIVPEEAPTLAELYSRLPTGVGNQFTQKLGMPLLLIGVIINSIIIHKKYINDGGNKPIIVLKALGVFSIMYIMLLPLGGYREYRPDVVRYDTMIPVTLCIMCYFAHTCVFIIGKQDRLVIKWLAPFYGLLALIFTVADKPKFDQNACEKAAIKQITMSEENVVKIPINCNVLSWEPIRNPELSSHQAELLHKWNITDEVKLYYQE